MQSRLYSAVTHWLMVFYICLNANIAATAPLSPNASLFTDGRFGKAANFASRELSLEIQLDRLMTKPPVVFEFWCKINSTADNNILLSAAPKTGVHWELFTIANSGVLSVYIPQIGAAQSGTLALEPGKWHYIVLEMQANGFRVFADGRLALEHSQSQPILFDHSPLRVGGIQDTVLGLDGAIDDLKISTPPEPRNFAGFVPQAPAEPDNDTHSLLDFDTFDGQTLTNRATSPNALRSLVLTPYSLPIGDRFLDEVMEDAYRKSALMGDPWVEVEAKLPAIVVDSVPLKSALNAEAAKFLSLDGEWLMKESEPRSVDTANIGWEESEGTAKGWWKQGFNRDSWRRVQVPTTVQQALILSGELPDPFWDSNTYDELTSHGQPVERGWSTRRTRIEQKDWWFARQFTLPETMKGKRLRLYFDGIDYAGSFYLNGQPLGYHAGMFGGPTYDVSNLIRHDEPNELVVRIDRAADMWLGILKGSPGFGWHYGHLISMGIWRSVRLESIPELEIESPYVKTLSISPEIAVLEIEYFVSNSGDEAQTLQVAGSISGKNHQAQPLSFANQVSAPVGLSRIRTQVQLDRPQLWWPMNYGDQNLYELNLNAGGQQAAPVTFGVRTVEMMPLRGAKPESDYRWQFVINGVPMFIKGANWCWTDPLLQADPAKYEHILELARRGGIQMFRAWGGGIIENDIFYQKCNEKGLMVYQEFPFCWGPPDFPITNPQMVDQQAATVIKRLRNHPSLVMWGGGNENVEIKGADEALFLVGRRSRQYDPSRPFHRTSPWGGSFHQWGVYHSGMPIDNGFVQYPAPWLAEFGIPSMTNWNSSLKYLPEEKLHVWPPRLDDGGVMSHLHQFGYGDLAKVMRYADYGPINDWKTYIEYSQMAQGDGISFAGNLQRAGSYLNKGGFWFYKMTDLLPGHSWAVVDFYGSPKLSYYRAKQICTPQAAFAFYKKYDWAPGETFKAAIHVSNDSNKSLSAARVEVTIYGSELNPAWSKQYAVDTLATSEQRKLDDIAVEMDPKLMTPFLMGVALRDSAGNLLSDQWYWFNFRSKSDAVKQVETIPAWGWPHNRAPEAFAAYAELPEARLRRLPATSLTAEIRQKAGKGEIVIQNKSDRPAFNVIIDGFPHEYGNYLDNNSFSIYPNETRSIGFELADPQTRLEHVTVRAWNAPIVQP